MGHSLHRVREQKLHVDNGQLGGIKKEGEKGGQRERRGPEILALKNKSSILGKWSNPVSGARKSQASSPWAKQHRVYPVIHGPVPSWKNHIEGWMNVRESYSPALEQGTLHASMWPGKNPV